MLESSKDEHISKFVLLCLSVDTKGSIEDLKDPDSYIQTISQTYGDSSVEVILAEAYADLN